MGKDILSYADCSKICNVIKSFTEFKQNIEKEDIHFPISSGSIKTNWRIEHLIKLESYTDQIDTSQYVDFTINKIYFKGFLIFILGKDMRDTRDDVV